MKRILCAVIGTLALLASPAHAGAQPDDKLSPGEGAVLFTVAVDYPTSGNVNQQQPHAIPQLSVEKIDEPVPRRFLLQPRLGGLQSARAYAGSLPPGRYRIHDLMGSNCKFFCGQGVSMPKSSDLTEFTVEAGRLSYLGTVLVLGEYDPPSKQWDVHWAYTDKPDAALGKRLLDGLYPEMAALQPLPFAAGWLDSAGSATVAAAARDAIRSRASGLFEPSAYGPDGFSFGAQHGVIKRWNPAEGFRLIDTGTPYVLRSVVHGAGGNLLAAGEASTLLHSADEGRTWTDASAGLPFGIIAQAKSIGGDELVFTLIQDKSVSLYRGQLSVRDWKKLGEYPLAFATWTGMPGTYPELQVQGRRLALTLPSKNAVYLDLDSGETHPIAVPGSIAYFSFTADGVMRCSCVRSIATNPWESRDLGRTWQPSDLDRFMLLPTFKNASEGFTYKGGWLSAKKASLMATADGGKTWTPIHTPSSLAWWRSTYSQDGSVMMVSGVAMLYGKQIEQIHVSTDGGDNWIEVPIQPTWLFPPRA